MRKKDRRSTLLMTKVHLRNYVMRRREKRATPLIMRAYLGRRVMRMKKSNNMFLVKIH